MPERASLSRLATLAVVSAAALGSAGAGAAAGAQDSFYLPPSPLPAGKPGDLIRAEPMEAYTFGRVNRLPARAWRVLYRSTAATGQAIAVSGTVLVPEAPYTGTGPRPIVGYSVGTRGIADRCAPSRTLAQGGEPEAKDLGALLARGWAVALTDWQGLGTPGDHTYVVGRAEGQAVLDAIRAARRLPPAGLPAGGPLGLMGYSQGGHSTAWAAQLQPSYAPELKLAGAAAGAVPADLVKVAANLDGSYAAGLLLYAAIGMNAAYPELALDRYLNDAGRRAVAEMRDDCLFDGRLVNYSFRRMREYTTADVPSLPAWAARLRENGPGATAPAAPTLLYRGQRDELIPPAVVDGLAARWCSLGANVRVQTVPGVDHSLTGQSLGSSAAIAWLADRFASGPPPRPAQCRLPARARPRCLARGGSARGTRLGPARLGRTRIRQRRVIEARRLGDRRGIDRWCVRGGGALRVGYASRHLTRAQRRAAGQGAVLVLVSSRRFSVAGIRPGARSALLRRRLRGERRLRAGRSRWYVLPRRRSTLVYRVAAGRVVEAGIADRRLAGRPRDARRLLGAAD